MGDVSCQMFTYFTAAAEAGLVDLDALLQGLPVSRDVLENPRARVSWTDWLALTHRFADLLPPRTDLRAVSADLTRREAVLRPVAPLARWALSTEALYRYGLRIAGAAMYPGIRFATARRGSALHVHVEIPPPLTPSRVWTELVAGGLVVLPSAMGLPDAEVLSCTCTDRTVDLVIRARRKPPLRLRLRHAWNTLVGSEAILSLLDQQSADVASLSGKADDAARDAASHRATVEALTAALPDLVLRVDRTGHLRGYLAGNAFPGAAILDRFIGRPLESFIGALPDLPSDADIRTALARLAHAIETGTETQLTVRTNGPSPRHLEIRCVPTRDDACVVLIRDVTELEHLREQLAVTERLATLGTLAAGAAHEINNPLTYTIMNLSLARESLAGDPARADTLAAVTDALDGADRIARIVRDLQALSRTEGVRVEPVDLGVAVARSLRLVHHALDPETQVEVEVSGLPEVAAEPGQTVQVLVNLLTNAAHAIASCPRPGGHIHIRGAVIDGTRVCLTVTDDGCGMTDDVKARALDPFFTTRRGEGTGLGLAISRRIMRSFGGSLTIRSAPAEGTTIALEFPIAHSTDDPITEPTEEVPAAAPGRLLLVDDDAPVRQALARMLDRHEVIQAASAAEALSLLDGDPGFDLVLCDLMMPGTSGMKLYQDAIARYPALRDRFVFITGGTPDPGLTEALAASGRPCLTKPFHPDRLRRSVDLALLTTVGRTRP